MRIEFEMLSALPPAVALAFDATEADITDAAEKAARRVQEALAHRRTEASARAHLGRLAGRYGVDLPRCKTFAGIAARMTDPAWWRRAFRKRFQKAEIAAIQAGQVHRRAASYVSDAAMRREEKHVRQTAQFLASHEAVNIDTGEIAPLAELAENTLANPANRRAYMMATVRHLEAVAKERGCIAAFLTITCPSRMHARLAATGDANPAYDGTSPRQAQRYLARLWNAANRKLARDGVRPFGVRVVEPHHDATPHWHVLAFVAPAQVDILTATLREYALLDSPNEPGAAEHRFTAQRIDPAKGSAAGYVAKYVSKNIDGHGVGLDDETGTPVSETVNRVAAWAHLWNARQFQFFGIGAMTPFRELRRLDLIPEALEPVLGDLWRAAKQPESDFATYVRERDRRGMRLSLWFEPCQGSRYPDEEGKRLRGIVIRGDGGRHHMETRPEEWQIRPSQEAVERRRITEKRLSEGLRGGDKHPSLGLASITPRDIDLTGISDMSNTYRHLNDGTYVDEWLRTVKDVHGNEVGRYSEAQELKRTAALFVRAGYVWSQEAGMWVKAAEEGEAPCAGNRFPAQGIANRTRL